MGEQEYQRIFSVNLRRYMSKCGKTQMDLIKDLGFNKSAVSTWVNGTRLPRMDKVDALAKYFGINRSDLLENKKERESDFSPLEMVLIYRFRSLSEEGRRMVLGALGVELDENGSPKNYLFELARETVRKESAG